MVAMLLLLLLMMMMMMTMVIDRQIDTFIYIAPISRKSH